MPSPPPPPLSSVCPPKVHRATYMFPWRVSGSAPVSGTRCVYVPAGNDATGTQMRASHAHTLTDLLPSLSLYQQAQAGARFSCTATSTRTPLPISTGAPHAATKVTKTLATQTHIHAYTRTHAYLHTCLLVGSRPPRSVPQQGQARARSSCSET